MDVTRTIVLKEHDALFVGDAGGSALVGEHGLYDRDTRFLSRYVWRWLPGDDGPFRTLVADIPGPDTLRIHHARIDGQSQLLAVRRTLRVRGDGLDDELVVENTSPERQSLSIELEAEADFTDAVEARDRHHQERVAHTAEVGATTLRLSHTASDGGAYSVILEFDALAAARPDGADWELSLAPGERVTLGVRVTTSSPLADSAYDSIESDA